MKRLGTCCICLTIPKCIFMLRLIDKCIKIQGMPIKMGHSKIICFRCISLITFSTTTLQHYVSFPQEILVWDFETSKQIVESIPCYLAVHS